jgi:hypothetical protein
MGAETPTAWTQKMVPVPVWALMALGAAMAGGGGLLGMSQAEASGAPDPAQIEQILSGQRRIEGRLDAIERQLATVAAMAHTHTGVINAPVP